MGRMSGRPATISPILYDIKVLNTHGSTNDDDKSRGLCSQKKMPNIRWTQHVVCAMVRRTQL